MLKRIFIIMTIVSIYIVGCYYSYLKLNKEDEQQIYLKTVVYKTDDDLLVPVSLNFYNEMDIEQEIINRIDIMKSDILVEKGLFPLFDENLNINHIDLVDNTLNIDFNDNLIANKNELDIIESLSYILFDYDEIEKVKITINGNEINSIPNSSLSLDFFTGNIGLNNFNETDEFLHHTYPIMIYHIKKINNKDYFVPITTRISNNLDLVEQINEIINLIDPKLTCKKAVIDNNKLYISLNSDILIDDGMIDKNLYKQLSLTFSSLTNIEGLVIEVNNENIIDEDVTSLQINYIKI